jgi:hypothetical protein
VAIDFVDPETGFEALQDGDLLRTDDGGTTWDVVSHKGFAALSFVSAPVGFGLTDHAYVLETTDGGRSWRERLNGASKAGYPDAGVGSLDFLNAQDGWAAPYQSGRIYRTTNGGASWDAESRVCVGATSAFSFVNVARGFRILRLSTRGRQSGQGSFRDGRRRFNVGASSLRKADKPGSVLRPRAPTRIRVRDSERARFPRPADGLARHGPRGNLADD